MGKIPPSLTNSRGSRCPGGWIEKKGLSELILTGEYALLGVGGGGGGVGGGVWGLFGGGGGSAFC